MMRVVLFTVAIVVTTLACTGTASAFDCPSWQRMGPPQQETSIRQAFEQRVAGDRAESITSKDVVGMRACFMPFVPRIQAEFDQLCADGSAGMDALDDTFKRYFMSCRQ